MKKVTPDSKWKSIRNTRWTADDGKLVRSGAELARRLMDLGLAEDVSQATDMLYGIPRGGRITTGVSAYTRTW